MRSPTSARGSRLRAAFAVLTLASCSFTPQNNPITGGEVTVEREQEMTAEVAQQIRDHMALVNDPVLLDYVNELGQEIVGVTEPQPFLFRFALIEDEALNAFTIGGGYVYLNSGVLAQSFQRFGGSLADGPRLDIQGGGQRVNSVLKLVLVVASAWLQKAVCERKSAPSCVKPIVGSVAIQPVWPVR